MPTNHLETLAPTLTTLDAADVHAPAGMPIATILAEADDLAVLTRKDQIRQRLLGVGIDPARLDLLPVAVGACRQAQAQWVQARYGTRTQADLELIARADELRSNGLRAGRWNLRRDRRARATLDMITEGDDQDDLVQDLHELASLVDGNLAAFASDQSFDASTFIDEALQLAQQLSTANAEYAARMSPDQAKDLRDRAFTLLDDLVGELREAGRYAYHDDKAMRRKFTSAYWRRHNQGEPLSDPPMPTADDVNDGVDEPAADPV
jgi:hypothetical protein